MNGTSVGTLSEPGGGTGMLFKFSGTDPATGRPVGGGGVHHNEDRQVSNLIKSEVYNLLTSENYPLSGVLKDLTTVKKK